MVTTIACLLQVWLLAPVMWFTQGCHQFGGQR